MRFLEREVYAFCGERVRGAMPWARIFLFMGGPQKTTWAGDGPAADGSRVVCARARGQSNAEGTACESCAGKGKTDVFLFLGGKEQEIFSFSSGWRQQ